MVGSPIRDFTSIVSESSHVNRVVTIKLLLLLIFLGCYQHSSLCFYDIIHAFDVYMADQLDLDSSCRQMNST
jgi:hypothetical protein